MAVRCYVCKQPLNYVNYWSCDMQISLCNFDVRLTLCRFVYVLQLSLNQLQQRSQHIEAEQKAGVLSC